MTLKNLEYSRIILGSQSPRRQALLKELGITFEIQVPNVDEIYDEALLPNEVPVFLAELKAETFRNKIDDKTLVITADTIVAIDDEILGKPVDRDDAFAMLRKLSGRKHQVATGVCLFSLKKKQSFVTVSDVYFKPLSEDEIDFYITNFKPFDKAGAYGIQEWIGYIGIERIEGSYYNVMGLPVQRLYDKLQRF